MDDDSNSDVKTLDRSFVRQAPMLYLHATPNQNDSTSQIALVAGDGDGENGHVWLNTSQSVQIESGPPSMNREPLDLYNGVKLFADQSQGIRIERGDSGSADFQKIEMANGACSIWANPGSMIVLRVGDSLISISAEGITISAPMVKIN